MRTQRAYKSWWFRNHCATGMDQEGTRIQPPTPEPAVVAATHNSSSSDGERRRTIGPGDLLLRAAPRSFKDCGIRCRELNPTPNSRQPSTRRESDLLWTSNHSAEIPRYSAAFEALRDSDVFPLSTVPRPNRAASSAYNRSRLGSRGSSDRMGRRRSNSSGDA